MPWWFGRRAWLVPALAVVLLLLANGAVFYADMRTVDSENAQLAHAQNVLASLDQLDKNIDDAATGVLDVLLTGNASHPQLYPAALGRVRTSLARLQSLTNDNPDQHVLMQDLASSSAVALRELQTTISMQHTKGEAGAVDNLLTGSGKKAIDHIRSVISAMKSSETNLLAQRVHDANQSLATTRVALVLTTGADIVLLTGLVVLLQRNGVRASTVAEERAKLLDREQSARADAERERLVAQRERSRLETVFEAMSDATAVFDKHGNMLQANAAFSSLFQVDRSPDILEQSYADRIPRWMLRDETGLPIPPEQWPLSRVLAGEVLTGAATVDAVSRTMAGEDRMVSVSGAPLLDEAGNVTGAILVYRDETERRELTREVRLDRDRLHQVLDILPEAVMVADSTPRILVGNQAAVDILGLDLVGLKVPISSNDGIEQYGARNADETPLPAGGLPLGRSVFRGEVVHGAQLLLRNAITGREVPVLANSAPLRDENGAIIGGVVVFQDITELKDLEQQKDDFLAAAAHDLKNPLTVITVQVQMLLRRVEQLENDDAATIRAGLATINRTARNMTQQIGELVDSSYLQMGRALRLDLRSNDLTALLRELVEEYGHASQRHSVRFETDNESVMCICDRQRLYRALANVLTNAIKYSPEGGEISVMLGVAARLTKGPAVKRASIRVIDHGLGIPASELPRVFDRYYRASNVGHIGGTGIGLSGVRQIVEQHGGSISVVSAEGEGTTVTILIPIEGPAET